MLQRLRQLREPVRLTARPLGGGVHQVADQLDPPVQLLERAVGLGGDGSDVPYLRLARLHRPGCSVDSRA